MALAVLETRHCCGVGLMPTQAGGAGTVLDSSRSGWEYESEDAPPPPQEPEDLEVAASSERAFQAPGRGGDDSSGLLAAP